MKHYFFVKIKMKDEEIYKKYLKYAQNIFSKYNGNYLAVDTDAYVIEGSEEFDRIVLIEFPGKKDFEDWYYSDDYQAILKYRLEGADCNAVLVKALN